MFDSPVVGPLVVTGSKGTGGTLAPVATLRLFARAREVAGRAVDTVTPEDLPRHSGDTQPGETQSGNSQSGETLTVDDVIAVAVARYGPDFAALLPTCRIWVNGEPVPGITVVGEADEVAVLPPVSGG